MGTWLMRVLWILLLFLSGLLVSACTEIEKVFSVVLIILVLVVAAVITLIVVAYHNKKHLTPILNTVQIIKNAVASDKPSAPTGVDTQPGKI